MTHIQWARSSQFNWVYDNMGGAPLQEAVAGAWSGAVTQVQADGSVRITSPFPGGGQVYYLRGVWRRETLFAWNGFWADPIDGDLVNYFSGGSFVNAGAATTVLLGTALPPGAWVQVYYLYLTGEFAGKYEALNNYPCIRRAYRARDDYTYDFAVDRLLDLMVTLHQAGQAEGVDYGPMVQFLWDAFYPRQESRTAPLVYDSFERTLWDRGAHLLYRDDTQGGAAFQIFRTELALEAPGRCLHVRAGLPTVQDGAWFGYGLDWSLEQPPFSSLDRLIFTLKGRAETRRLHQVTKLGSGSATLMFLGDYQDLEKRRFVIQIETTGEVGAATCCWSQNGGLNWEAAGVITGDRDHPLALTGGFSVYWAGGGGTDLVAGDTWTFWGGDPAEHPRRLLVTLNDSSRGDPDPWGPQHLFVHALPDRYDGFTILELPFDQFWRRDNLVDDGDRVRATWGTWYATGQPDDSQLTLCDREETEVLEGKTFYTQRVLTWDLSPYVTAFGAWVGVDTNVVNSAGHVSLNFLIKPVVSGANTLTMRIKVKDALGSYFYADRQVTVNAWQRVTVNLAEMLLESGQQPLTHPLQVVDVGMASSPPSNGFFYLTDIKFDEHRTFAGADRLRLLEFKMEQQGLEEHEWWLDEVILNLDAQDPYPYAPRLAISLGPGGQNPWRGPTLVHYAHPLGPHLAGALNISQTYVRLHREAQEAFVGRYGGVRGPVVPVHTRNDLENVALCGEENFGKFCWWPKWRDYGLLAAAWHFNGGLGDASNRGRGLAWSSGSPAYTAGVCQPGPTALAFDGGGAHAHHTPGTDFLLWSGDFTLEMVAKFSALTGAQALMGVWQAAGDQRSWVLYRDGQSLALAYSTNGANSVSATGGAAITLPDTYYHLVAVRSGSTLAFYVNGQPAGSASIGSSALFAATASFRLGAAEGGWPGALAGAVDYAAVHRGRAMSAAEIASRWRIIQGLENGSDYPEVGSALGQYWAFYRLAQYYFATNDPGACEILEHWLAWLDAVGAPDGLGWKFPVWFSDYGFTYGAYDPGAAASLALGCLYVHLRNGHAGAAVWARRILDDLRQNRESATFGGGYRSDHHYAWLNALVMQAFGLAVQGRSGQAFPFPATPDDAAHFQGLLAWLFAHAGDVKPNLLNADLIPFTYLEAVDVWDYAPDYVFMRQMGSLEALVLMLGVALEQARADGDWVWFHRLLAFILTDNLVRLGEDRIRSLTNNVNFAGIVNRVRLRYADYDQDNARYAEAVDQQALQAWGERALDLDCRYGAPVILENPDLAQLLADRLLQRLASPWDHLSLDTWLEGARVEVGDSVAVTSAFHGLEAEEYAVFGKTVDLGGRRVRLELGRPLNRPWALAVDAAGTDYDNYAIDQASPYDAN